MPRPRQTNATSVIMHPFRQGIIGTYLKSQSGETVIVIASVFYSNGCSGAGCVSGAFSPAPSPLPLPALVCSTADPPTPTFPEIKVEKVQEQPLSRRFCLPHLAGYWPGFSEMFDTKHRVQPGP